jgi:hypothetical protein
MHHDDGQYLPARLALLPAARQYVTHLTQRPGGFVTESGQSGEKPNGCPVDSAEDGETGRRDGLQRRVFSLVELSLAALVAPYLSPELRHVYHLLTHGQAYANVEDGQRIALSAGNIVVFPHGDPQVPSF